jgi:hypothetical protein
MSLTERREHVAPSAHAESGVGNRTDEPSTRHRGNQLGQSGATDLTKQQRKAIEHPCLLAEETMHQRYFAETALGTVIVTINTGYE